MNRKKNRQTEQKKPCKTNIQIKETSINDISSRNASYSPNSQSKEIYQSSSENSSCSNTRSEKADILKKIESDNNNNNNSAKQEASNSNGQNENSSGSFIPLSISTKAEQIHYFPNANRHNYFIGNPFNNQQSIVNNPLTIMAIQNSHLNQQRNQVFIPYSNNFIQNQNIYMTNIQNIGNRLQNNLETYYILIPVNPNSMENPQSHNFKCLGNYS